MTGSTNINIYVLITVSCNKKNKTKKKYDRMLITEQKLKPDTSKFSLIIEKKRTRAKTKEAV